MTGPEPPDGVTGAADGDGSSVPPAPERLCELYTMLSAPRRWYTIFLLASATEQSLTVQTVAKRITAIQEDIPPSHATGDAYTNRYNSLCQTHLPALDEVDIVRYDAERKRLTTGPSFPLALVVVRLSYASYDAMERLAGAMEKNTR